MAGTKGKIIVNYAIIKYFMRNYYKQPSLNYSVLFLLLFSLTVTAQKNDTIYYSVVHKDTLIGKQLIWNEKPNHIHYIYQYDQKGFKQTCTRS